MLARRDVPAVAVLALVATVLALVATRNGPGLTSDSTIYLSSGVELARSGRLLPWDGQSLTIFPPGLPAIVALGERIGLGAETTARAVPALSFGAIVMLGHVLLRRHVRSAPLVWSATVVLAVSAPLYQIGRLLLTEAPFAVVGLSLLLVLERVWRRRSFDLGDLTAASALCWGAFLLRYVGLVFIPIVGVVVVLACWRQPARDWIVRAAAFGLAVLIVPVGWMLRNHAVDGTVLGPRSPSDDTVMDLIRGFRYTTSEWLVPLSRVPHRSLITTMFGIALVACLVGLRPAGWTAALRGLKPAVPLAVFTVAYLAYVSAAELTTAIDPIDSRLLSPVYVPLVVVTTMAVDRALERARSRHPLWAPAVVGLVGTFALMHATVVGSDVRRESRHGVALDADSYRASETAAIVAALPADATIYSSRADVLWVVSQRRPLYRAPFGRMWQSTERIPGAVNTFAQEVACADEPVYLAWFSSASEYNLTPAELAEGLDVRLVSDQADGDLYRLRARPGTSCAT